MLSHEETRALVVRAQRGDPGAFAALAGAYLRAAYSVALAVVGRAADAEDVAQDAMVVAFQRIGSCREPARFGGWLLQIARNRAKNWLEARRLREVPGAAPEAPAVTQPVGGDAGLRTRLLAALDGLPVVQREVVLLHDLEGWTHAEIARALELSELMSRQHLFQARKLLRRRLATDAPEENHG